MRTINYHGGQKIYDKDQVDLLLQQERDNYVALIGNEASVREADDNDIKLLIDQEAQTREASDAVLDGKIAQEETSRMAKDTELETLIRASLNVQCGEMMYWPVSKCVEREFHSDHPFKFTWRGQEYEVEPEDPVIHRLDVADNVPMGWHACDGTCVSAEEYPKLAEFMPDNVDKDGNIWIPYIRKTIIKIVE